MKGLFIVAILACFALSLIQCASTGEPINVALGKDPKLANLSHAVTEMYHAVKMADRLFEENRHNSARLVKLVEEIKELNAVLKGLQIEIRTEMATHPFRSFYNRFALEALLIQSKYHERLLVDIAKEVLAERAGVVTSFAVYETSDIMLVARDLMVARYADMLTAMFEVDKLLVEAFANGSTTVSPKTKADIDQHFRKILTIDQLLKDELATDYYKEVERIRLQDKELSLEMKMEFHVGIDMQNYLLAYVKNYEELFLKIVS